MGDGLVDENIKVERNAIISLPLLRPQLLYCLLLSHAEGAFQNGSPSPRNPNVGTLFELVVATKEEAMLLQAQYVRYPPRTRAFEVEV